jgi:hypothetical protein
MALSKIDTAGLAADAVDNTIVDLADNYTYSGSVAVPGHVVQVVSNNLQTPLAYSAANGSGQASVTNGWTVIPSELHTDITAKLANSKFFVQFDGNMSAGGGNLYGDWIGGFGLLVDPAGGTSWTIIGSGDNGAATTNRKFFISRASADGAGNDSYPQISLNASYLYNSSVSAGATLRFAVEYFHYYHATYHPTLYINRSQSATNSGSSNAYQGASATTLTVMEIAQ